MASYQRLFNSLIVAALWLLQLPTLDVLAFMDYLIQVSFTASNITNYLTAIRSTCIACGSDTTPSSDQRIPLFVKAINTNRPLGTVYT